MRKGPRDVDESQRNLSKWRELQLHRLLNQPRSPACFRWMLHQSTCTARCASRERHAQRAAAETTSKKAKSASRSSDDAVTTLYDEANKLVR